MKKALVLLLAFALVGGLVFAEEIVYSTAPSISGNGQVSWGVNFNDSSTGFVNSGEAKVNFPLIAKQSATHTGDAIYGEVVIADIELDFGNDATTAQGSATAKVLLPNSLYVQVYAKPGFGCNNAKPYAPWVSDAFGDTAYGGSLVQPDWTSSTGGITFGMGGDFSFALKVASVGAYNTATAATAAVPAVYGWIPDSVDPSLDPTWGIVTDAVAAGAATENNVDNAYGFGADLGYKIPDLMSINASFVYGPTNTATPEDNNIVGFSVKANVAPKDLGLTLNAALDGMNATVAGTAVFGIDASFDVEYKMANLFSAGAAMYFGDIDLDSDPAAARLDARVRAAVLAVENLTAEFGVDLWDLMADPAQDPMWVFIGGKLAYKIAQGESNYIKPFAEFSYALDDANLALKAGVEAVLFPNGVLTAQYVAGANANNVVVDTGANALDDDKGTFTISCKVSY